MQTVCAELGARGKECRVDQVGSLHSAALAEARGSSKPQAHLNNLLRRSNQNQIIPFPFSHHLLVLRVKNYCYVVEEAFEIPGSLSSGSSSSTLLLSIIIFLLFGIRAKGESNKNRISLLTRASCGFPQ